MIPAAAVELCKRFEGLHRRGTDGLIYPYLCPAGVWTIGYGATGPDVAQGMQPWTVEQCQQRLLEDLARFTAGTLRLCPVLASEPEGRLAAIIDFAFNLGLGRLQTSTLRRRVNARDWPGAAEQLRRWVRGGGRVLPGLVLRREAEAQLLV